MADHLPDARKMAGEDEQPVVKAWVPVSERLPDPGLPVIACVVDRHGTKWRRRIRAQYAPPLTLEMSDDCADEGDYDDATDTLYCKAGWYEDNEYEDTHWLVTDEVTHWMPLPDFPEP